MLKNKFWVIIILLIFCSCSSYYFGTRLKNRSIVKVKRTVIYKEYKIGYDESNPPFGYPDNHESSALDFNKYFKGRDNWYPFIGSCYGHSSHFWDQFTMNPNGEKKCYYRYNLWFIDKEDPKWDKKPEYYDMHSRDYIYENTMTLLSKNNVKKIGDNEFYYYLGGLDKYRAYEENSCKDFRKKQDSQYYLLKLNDAIYLQIKFLYFKVKGEEELINQIIEDMLNSIKVTFKESKTE